MHGNGFQYYFQRINCILRHACFLLFLELPIIWISCLRSFDIFVMEILENDPEAFVELCCSNFISYF